MDNWQARDVTGLDPQRALVFGAHAEDYERWRPGYPDAAVDWLVPPDATRVADVGAGTGKLTGPLLARGLRVAAVEPDAGMLAVLTRLHPDAEPHLAGAQALPLPDARVDAVLVAQAWHWFPHEQAVAEVVRVLRPGGWLGLLWNGPDPREPWELALARLDPDSGGRDFTARQKVDVGGLPSTELETATFPWIWEISAAHLRARLATHSALVVMDADERERRLDASAAVVAAEAERRGTATVPLSQAAACVRWRPS